jgi:hypothetical protein
MDQYRSISVELCRVLYVLRILSFAFLYQTDRPGEGIKYFMNTSKVSLKWIYIDESLSIYVPCHMYSE